MAAQPLGRHERGGAREVAGRGEGRLVGHRGDAEVGQDDPAVLGEQDVLGLHVTVEHPGGVRRAERAEDLGADARDRAGIEGTVRADDLAERAGADQLHDDPGPAVLLDDVVDDDHRRMVEAPGGPRLADRAPVEGHAVFLADRVVEDLLDRDRAVEEVVVGPPDHAHAATADRLQQVISAGDPALRLRGHVAPTLLCPFPHRPIAGACLERDLYLAGLKVAARVSKSFFFFFQSSSWVLKSSA